MITIYENSSQSITEIDEISENCWINIYPPVDYNAIKDISEKLNIYIEFFTDALDIDEQSRYDEEDDGTRFILLNTPMRNENVVSNTRAFFITSPISIVVKNNIIITTSLHRNPVIESVINKAKRADIYSSIENLILSIFEQNTNFFLYYLKQINQRFNEFEKIIDSKATNRDFVSILKLQKSLIYFETNLRTNNLMMIKMKRTDFLSTIGNEKYDDYFDEIIVENQQAIEMTEVYSRILDSNMQVISSIVSNNVNTIVTRLTGATIILMIPSIISGFLGMNVPIPFNNNKFGFIIITLFTIALLLVIVYVFRRRKWI